MTPVASVSEATTARRRSMASSPRSSSPDRLATWLNVPGLSWARCRAPKPPMEIPAMARSALSGMVRRFPSMNGTTWSTSKSAQSWAPAAVVWSAQLEYQPRAPPSGMTMIIPESCASALNLGK